MIIQLFTEEQRATLVEVDDLNRLHVEVHGSATEADLQLALGRLGRLGGTEYAWISVDELRRASGRSNDSNWHDAFGRMVEFAKAQGWTDANHEDLRAHIVSGPSADPREDDSEH